MSTKKTFAERFGISSKRVGLAPGAVVFTGERAVDESVLSLIRYAEAEVLEDGPVTLADLRLPEAGAEATEVQWVDFVGLHDTELIAKLGEHFSMHPLLLEDVVSVRGRPTFVDYDDHAYLSLKMLSWHDDHGVTVEHISLVMGEGYVVSFQERPGDVFDSVRERLRSGRTKIRKRGADYLWYALIDAVVDQYLVTVEGLSRRIDDVEEIVWNGNGSNHEVPAMVQAIRAETVTVRRSMMPLRDEIEALTREPSEWFDADLLPFLNDLREHLRHISDVLDSIRDSLTGVMDAHLSLLSMRTNDVMKVLTIMASIFIPLTFVAGIYGMNFQHMPELAVRWAYPAVWGVMVTMAVGMIVYFRRRGWM